MYEPERSLEPPEPKVILTCEVCGCDICEGDEYFELPDSLMDIMCEDCARNWLEEYRKVAGGQP